MTTPQQIILRGSPHVDRFVPHPMSHGSKKTRDEPKQHLDIDPYPYPSGKSSKKSSKAYTNVKVKYIRFCDLEFSIMQKAKYRIPLMLVLWLIRNLGSFKKDR
jgi:hypothetical protein